MGTMRTKTAKTDYEPCAKGEEEEEEGRGGGKGSISGAPPPRTPTDDRGRRAAYCIIHVGMSEIVEVHASSQSSHSSSSSPQTEPCYSYRNGKPKKLLVLDSTWNTLVFYLDRYYKDIFAEQSKALARGGVALVVALSFALLILADFFPWLLIPLLVVLLASLAYLVYVKHINQEELLQHVLQHEGLYDLFAQDGYTVEVERQPSMYYPCSPNTVGLRFEHEQHQPAQCHKIGLQQQHQLHAVQTV